MQVRAFSVRSNDALFEFRSISKHRAGREPLRSERSRIGAIRNRRRTREGAKCNRELEFLVAVSRVVGARFSRSHHRVAKDLRKTRTSSHARCLSKVERSRRSSPRLVVLLIRRTCRRTSRNSNISTAFRCRGTLCTVFVALEGLCFVIVFLFVVLHSTSKNRTLPLSISNLGTFGTRVSRTRGTRISNFLTRRDDRGNHRSSCEKRCDSNKSGTSFEEDTASTGACISRVLVVSGATWTSRGSVRGSRQAFPPSRRIGLEH